MALPTGAQMRAFLAECRLAVADQATLGFRGLMQEPTASPLLLRAQHDPLRASAPADDGADVSTPANHDVPAPATLPEVRARLGHCTRCRLHETRTSIVFGTGNPQAKLMFVGEGPGRDEDLEGEPFVGEAGRLLDRMLRAMGTSRADIYIANVIKCRPPKNRFPEKDEVATCLPFLREQIAAIGPEVVVALGRCALESLLGRPVRITKERGTWLPFEIARRPIQLMPTLHPAYLLRNPADKGLVWQDLQAVMHALDMPLPTGRKDAPAASRG